MAEPPQQPASPEEIELLSETTGEGLEALVERLVDGEDAIGVELKLGDGRAIEAHVTPEHAQELELRVGQFLFVRPRRQRRAAS